MVSMNYFGIFHGLAKILQSILKLGMMNEECHCDSYEFINYQYQMEA